MKKKCGTAAGIILLAAILIWYKGEAETVGRTEVASPVSFVVVIDPGHGGPGNRPKIKFFRAAEMKFCLK